MRNGRLPESDDALKSLFTESLVYVAECTNKPPHRPFRPYSTETPGGGTAKKVRIIGRVEKAAKNFDRFTSRSLTRGYHGFEASLFLAIFVEAPKNRSNISTAGGGKVACAFQPYIDVLFPVRQNTLDGTGKVCYSQQAGELHTSKALSPLARCEKTFDAIRCQRLCALKVSAGDGSNGGRYYLLLGDALAG
jgi:hypothetical protein